MIAHIPKDKMDILTMKTPWNKEHELHTKIDVQYPGGKEFCGVLTHDVDFINWSLPRRILLSIKHPSTLSNNKNYYWGIDDICDMETEHRVKSTFYFISKCRTEHDGPYDIYTIEDELKQLDKNGWEVGLHGSFNSYMNYDYLSDEKAILEKILGHSVAGIRQHYANFDPEMTWSIQEKCGFIYDSTIGFTKKEGFKVGYCYPYQPDGMNIFELPFTIMDCSLLQKGYRAYPYDKALLESKKVIDIVKEAHGVVVLNWHNNSWDPYTFPRWAELYNVLIEHILDSNGSIKTANELMGWWQT